MKCIGLLCKFNTDRRLEMIDAATLNSYPGPCATLHVTSLIKPPVEKTRQLHVIFHLDTAPLRSLMKFTFRLLPPRT
jgi:hypothetical protein